MERLEKQAVRLMIVRTVVAFTFFLSALGVQLFVGEAFSLGPFFYFTAFVLFLNVVYGLFFSTLKPWRNRPIFIYIQLSGDIVAVTLLAFFTGGINSVYTFLYHLLIVVAGFLLKKRGAFIVAVIDCLVYGLFCVTLFYHWLDPERLGGHFPYDPPTAGSALYALLAHYVGFFLVAALMSVMSERMEAVRSALGIMEKDFTSLRSLNEQILSSLGWGVITMDMQGRVTFANPAAMRLMGESLPSGWSFHGRLVELGGPEVSATLDDVDNERELEVVLGSGRRHLSLSMAPLRAGQSAMGQLVFIRDQTEIAKLKEQVQLQDRLAATGAMAADIAHEIRNPLGSISGAAQVLQRNSVDSGEHDLLRIIQEESRRLSGTLDNFLRYVRPTPLKRRVLDLGSLVDEVITLFRSDQRVREYLTIDTSLPQVPLEASVDADQLRQALWNLLTNARKAVREGEGVIRISLTAEDHKAILEVEDNGIGMSKAQVAEYFQPFRRGFSQGSGLGLSIIYRIVELHGGTIQVDSSPGKGTRCRLVLPLEASA